MLPKPGDTVKCQYQYFTNCDLDDTYDIVCVVDSSSSREKTVEHYDDVEHYGQSSTNTVTFVMTVVSVTPCKKLDKWEFDEEEVRENVDDRDRWRVVFDDGEKWIVDENGHGVRHWKGLWF